MKNKKLSFLYLAIGCFLLVGPITLNQVSAWELNSGNVTSYCATTSTSCDLRNKSITSIASGTFTNHSDLQNLYLNNNELTSLPAGIFNNLHDLRGLLLHSNKLKSIPAGIFDNLSNISLLELNNNELTSLPTDVFDDLSNISALYLNNNQLTSLPTGIFDNLSNLDRLYLNNNQLISLPAGIFDNLSILERLDLNGNELTSLPAGIFDNLSILERLDLSYNELTNLPANVFDNLSNLQYIYLNDNGFYGGYTKPAGVNGSDGDSSKTVNFYTGNETLLLEEFLDKMYSTSKSSLLNTPSGTYKGNYALDFSPPNSTSQTTHSLLIKRAKPTWYPDSEYYNMESEIYIPKDTIFQKGENNYTGVFHGPSLFYTGIFADIFNNTIAVMRVGNLMGDIQFKDTSNQNVFATVLMPAPGKTNGDTVKIYTSQNGKTRSLHTSTQVINKFGNPYIEFTTNHFSWFVVGDFIGEEGNFQYGYYVKNYKGIDRKTVNLIRGQPKKFITERDNKTTNTYSKNLINKFGKVKDNDIQANETGLVEMYIIPFKDVNGIGIIE